MSRPSAHRGYTSRVIRVADLEPHHLITAAGIGLLVEVRSVRHYDNGVTKIVYNYEVAGRARRAVRRCNTSGRITVHAREPKP